MIYGPNYFSSQILWLFQQKREEMKFVSSANLTTSFVICWEKNCQIFEVKKLEKRKEKPNVKLGKFYCKRTPPQQQQQWRNEKGKKKKKKSKKGFHCQKWG